MLFQNIKQDCFYLFAIKSYYGIEMGNFDKTQYQNLAKMRQNEQRPLPWQRQQIQGRRKHFQIEGAPKVQTANRK